MDKSLQTMKSIDEIEIARSTECTIQDLNKTINIKKSDITIMSQNIRSVYSNINDLQITLHEINFDLDIMILTECRIDMHKNIPNIQTYSTFMTTNHLNQNDGVVAYIKDGYKVSVREIKLIHASCLEIALDDMIILGIYRSPSNDNIDPFIDSLNTHLDSLKFSKNIIITGDININIIPKPSEKANERKNRLTYLDTLAMHGLLPGHCLPTRENNCLDHFNLKIDKTKIKAYIAVLDTSITDHSMILMKLSTVTEPYLCHKTKTVINYEKAMNTLEQSKLLDLMLENDPNKLTNVMVSKINEAIQENTTIIKIPKCKRVIKPWITIGILRCIRNRNKMQKQLSSDPDNIILRITFRRYRNFCNNLIKKLKRNYDKAELEKSSHNPKSLWNSINKITNYKQNKSSNLDLLKYKSSPDTSVNSANTYFTNVGKTLAENIMSNATHQSDEVNLPFPQSQTFVLLDTDPQEVETILRSLKSQSAPGWDGITTQFLKYAKHLVIPIISHLANVCFKNGEFPLSLKQSIITPVFKSGDKGEVGNYRPISVLPSISKILEKLINNRLIKYLQRFNILSKSQFGFRQGLSTEDAVTALTSLVTENVDKKLKCLTVFLDLRKAFDTVSVPILIRKLENIGIRENSLSLLTSYLSYRKQRVKIGQYVSGDTDITYGVPQGSVLGPTLFLIYINDLCNMSLRHGQIFSYADDTAIVFDGKTWVDLHETTEMGLAKVGKWLSNNLLTLNTSKTNYICFTPYDSTQKLANFKVKIHKCNNDTRPCNCSCDSIEKVSHTKYLGVYVDQRLSWHFQIEMILNRIRKLVWLFKHLRHIATIKILKSIYISLAQSLITYCLPIWGGAVKTKMIDIERAQRTLLKVIYFKPRRFPTTELYSLCEVLSVRKLYILNVILKTHKTLKYDPKTLEKRRCYMVIPPHPVKTKFAERQITKRATTLYNLANKHIKIYEMTIYECKKAVTKWLMDKSYEETEALLGT